MKIAIILPYLTNIGGAARYGWELSEYFARKGDQVIVISLYTDRKLYHSKEEIKIIDLAERDSFTQTIKFWLNLSKTRKKLLDLINQIQPDVILFNHFPSTLWAQKFGNIPVLCYPHDVNLLYEDTYTKNLTKEKQLLWKLFRIIIRLYEKQKWKFFNKVISNSKFTAKHLNNVYKIQPVVIYPGTNTQQFLPNKSSKKERSIMVIADHKTRRVDMLIKTAYRLYQRRKDFKIWIVGSSGNYDKEIRDLVRKLELNPVVEFFGIVSDHKLAELYSKALVLVHLQTIHPFGYIYIEAMSCGTPVIACKPGATEEVIVHNETGYLISDNDLNSLSNYLEKFLNDLQLSVSMGEKGRKRVKENFEKSKQYEKIRLFIQDYVHDFKKI